MGVYVSRNEDAEIYRDTFEEAQRIIRVSDEVRISLEKVEQHLSPSDSLEDGELDGGPIKLTSSKLAKKLGLKTPELLEKLIEKGYLSKEAEKHSLTEEGKNAGGEFKYSQRFGPYFIWPEDVSFD